MIGSRVVQFGLAWWLTALTGSATVLATASSVALLPEILLRPIAGAYVDRWNRRIVMIVADGLTALASLWLAYVFWADSLQLWHVYLIMAIRAVGSAFHWPAVTASTSLLVPDEQLARVAGLNQILDGVLNIAGPALGALLIALLPPYGVMLVDVGTAFVAIPTLFFTHIPQPQRKGKASERPAIWVDLREGLDYIWRWPGLKVLIGAMIIFQIGAAPSFSLLPLLVRRHHGGDAAQLGLMQSALGVGIVLGSLLLSAWGGFKRRIYTTLLGQMGMGVGFLVLGFTPGRLPWVAAASLFFTGLAIPLASGPLYAIMQGTVAPEVQGRVFSLVSSLMGISSPVALVAGGLISDWLGIWVWYVIAGVLMAALGGSLFFVPAFVHIEENVGETARVT